MIILAIDVSTITEVMTMNNQKFVALGLCCFVAIGLIYVVGAVFFGYQL